MVYIYICSCFAKQEESWPQGDEIEGGEILRKTFVCWRRKRGGDGIEGDNSWITSPNEVLEDTDHQPLTNTGKYFCLVEERESEFVKFQKNGLRLYRSSECIISH